MPVGQARHGNIEFLYKKAMTGKYNWDDLKRMARSMGVSEPTVKSYLDAVRAKLVKMGHIKDE